MTEDERARATKQLERRLQELDSKRLARIDAGYRIEKILCWGLMIFIACAVLVVIVATALKSY